MITKRQYIILSFFLTRSLFFGLGISKILNCSQNDSWLSAIIGTAIGIGILSFVYYFKKKHISYLPLLKKGIIGFICKLLLLFLASFCLHDVIISLTTMTSSFLLPLTPPVIIAIAIIITIIYGNKKGVSSFAKVAEILIPISLLIILIKIIASSFISDYTNFLPLLYGHKIGIIKGSLIYCALSVAPCFLLLIIKDIKLSYKDVVSGYILGSFSIILTFISVIGVLGPTLANIMRYPEYMTLKKLRIFNFIENIENILAFTWLFDLIILGYMSAYNIKEIIKISLNNKKVAKISYLLWIVIIGFVGVYIFNKYYYLTIDLYNLEPYIIAGTIISLIIAFFLLVIKYKNKND